MYVIGFVNFFTSRFDTVLFCFCFFLTREKDPLIGADSVLAVIFAQSAEIDPEKDVPIKEIIRVFHRELLRLLFGSC